jgi:hypothetical protein
MMVHIVTEAFQIAPCRESEIFETEDILEAP